MFCMPSQAQPMMVMMAPPAPKKRRRRSKTSYETTSKKRCAKGYRKKYTCVKQTGSCPCPKKKKRTYKKGLAETGMLGGERYTTTKGKRTGKVMYGRGSRYSSALATIEEAKQSMEIDSTAPSGISSTQSSVNTQSVYFF